MNTAMAAELSSMEYTINELSRRFAALGDELTRAENEIAASEMFQIEKSLVTAVRRIAKAQRLLS